MYDTAIGMGAGVAVGTTVAVAVLPNTGGELWVELGLSIMTGLVVWGVLYARKQKRALKGRV